jgi:hypothetical protein
MPKGNLVLINENTGKVIARGVSTIKGAKIIAATDAADFSNENMIAYSVATPRDTFYLQGRADPKEMSITSPLEDLDPKKTYNENSLPKAVAVEATPAEEETVEDGIINF